MWYIQKIEDKASGLVLREEIGNLSLREGMGVIIRTLARINLKFFDRDLNLLLQEWDQIEAKIQSQDSPAFLYEEPDLIGLTARDFLTDGVNRFKWIRKRIMIVSLIQLDGFTANLILRLAFSMRDSYFRAIQCRATN